MDEHGPFIDDLAAKPKAKAVSISGGIPKRLVYNGKSF